MECGCSRQINLAKANMPQKETVHASLVILPRELDNKNEKVSVCLAVPNRIYSNEH